MTICTQDRACLLGEVVGGKVHLNDAGRMVEGWWLELARKFSSVQMDIYVVMPNHYHCILKIGGADPRVRPPVEAMGNEYICGVRDKGWEPFDGRLWQRSYYEHVIRNEADLGRVRQYIVDNPAGWAEDPDNPRNIHDGTP